MIFTGMVDLHSKRMVWCETIGSIASGELFIRIQRHKKEEMR